MAIITVILTDRKQTQYVKKGKKKKPCSVSGHIFLLYLKKKKNELDSFRRIYLETKVIYQNIHVHQAFKGDPAVN